ncbi:MAG: hypothetical protein GY782_00150 [Gammaproteobacteria bacterium]|nr:hypothetical protein [Gammaproteobacteria bacterium]
MKSIILRAIAISLITLTLPTAVCAYPVEVYRPRTIIVTPAGRQRPIDVNVIRQSTTIYLQEANRVIIRRIGANRYKLIVHNKKNRLFWLKSRGSAERGSIGVAQFVNTTWFNGPMSMASTQPQAILIASRGRNDKSAFIAAFSLANPSYDPNSNTTRYDATLVFNNTPYNLNSLVVHNASLIIG